MRGSVLQTLKAATLSLLLTGCAVDIRPYLTSQNGLGSGGGSGLVSFITQLGQLTVAPGGNNNADDYCADVAVDTSGNSYCVGYTGGALAEAHGGGTYDAFVMKVNSSGGLVWVRQLGAVTQDAGGNNAGYDVCQSVAVDTVGNVYCAGYTDGAVGEANGGGTDAFVLKLNSSGVLQWVTQLGAVTTAPGGNNSGYDGLYGIALDATGVYVAGYTNAAIAEANAGADDAFVMKLDTSGVIQWARQLGAVTVAPGGTNAGAQVCMRVAVDASGVYCAGNTSGAMGEAVAGSNDAFVMKLSLAGVLQWVRQLGAVTTAPGGSNAGADFCQSVTLDSSSNVYCGGYTTGSLGEANGGMSDAFVMKLNTSGVLQWVRQLGAVTVGAGSSGDEYCNGVATDGDDNLYCTGFSTGNFGEANGGDYDVMALRLTPTGTVDWITQLGAVTAPGTSSAFESCRGAAVDGSGSVYCAGQTRGTLGEASTGSADPIIVKLE